MSPDSDKSVDTHSGSTQDLDLTQEPATTPKALPGPVEKPWSPEPQREQMRGVLALFLVSLLATTVTVSFLLVALDVLSTEEAKDLLEPILPALVGLTGTAIGFYFGGQQKQ